MPGLPFLRPLLRLTLLATVVMTSAVEDAVRVKRSDDVSTSTSLNSGELQTCQASLMLMMQAELTSLRTRVESLENNVTSLKNTVITLENSLQNATSRAVAFTARISGDRDRGGRGVSLGYQQTVIFNDVITNIGNAYNHHTGIFTAPVAGTYVFFLTLMGVQYTGDIYLDMVKNGVRLDMMFALGGHNSFDQGSTQVSTQLGEGDQVWVRQAIGDAVRGDWWTVFTGYLLHAD